MSKLRIGILAATILTASCGEQDQMRHDFFAHFKPADLGGTAIVEPNPTIGLRGPYVKILDIRADEAEAALVNFSFRAEYSIQENAVSAIPRPAIAILNATNATPIAITSNGPHGLVTGEMVTINGVTGNGAANGAFTITVTGANTFTLNGSVGSGAYTGGGTFVSATAGGNGSGVALLGGPLVGRILWGVGGAYNVIEFDIPNPRLPDTLEPQGFPESYPVADTGNGMTVSVYGSAFEVSVRSDGNLRTVLNAQKGQTPAGIGEPSPAKVMVFASPGGTSGAASLKRTIHVAGAGDLMLAGDTATITIPMMAKRFWLWRVNAAAPIIEPPFNIIVRNTGAFALHEIAVGANQEGPFELHPGDDNMDLTNVGTDCSRVLVSFEVDPT